MIYTATSIQSDNHLANFNIDVDEFTAATASMNSYYGEKGVFVPNMDNYLDVHVKKISTLQGNGLLLMCMNKQNKPVFVARLITAPVPQGALPWGYRIYVVDRVKVHPKWAGRGVCGSVYTWLSENGYTLVSDSHQSQNSLAVWKKLAATEKVYMFDMDRGGWKPYDPTKVEDWVLFGNGNMLDYWPVRLILPAK